MQWKPGLILRIKDYKFEDDGSTRDKYAIVLCTNDRDLYLIHSLTTSQNNRSVPGIHHGCSVHMGVPYYFIPARESMGNENFYFDKDTFYLFSSQRSQGIIRKI